MVLIQQVTCKVAVWQQHAHKVAEAIHTGMRIKLIKPSLVPANQTFAMGATSSVELRIMPDTLIEVLEENTNTIDASLYVHAAASRCVFTLRPLVKLEELVNGSAQIGTIVRVQARVYQASRIFESGTCAESFSYIVTHQTPAWQGPTLYSKMRRATRSK